MTEEQLTPEDSTTAVKIVRILIALECPKETHVIPTWRQKINTLRSFLEEFWKKDPGGMFQCLQYLYNEIVTNSENVKPAIWTVLDMVDKSKITEIVEGILNDTESNHDCKVELALTALIHGLCTCGPQYPSLKDWALSIVKGLEERGNFTVLTCVSEKVIKKLTCSAYLPIFRKLVFPVFYQFLYPVVTPHVFFKGIDNITRLFQVLLTNAQHEETRVYLSELGALVSILMDRFPKFAYESKYSELRELIQKCPPGEFDCSSMVLWNPEQDSWSVSMIPDYRLPRTPYKGLVNLGNTCFMNSVLQVLYMTLRFRNEVLEKPADPNETALIELQQLFALMRESDRPVLSPVRLIDVSLPPTFRRGHQQDSSEYLIYLLDNIHENESKLIRRTRQNKSPLKQQGDIEGEGAVSAQFDTASIPSTIVERLFDGELISTTTCESCKKHFPKNDSFRDLPLSFPEHNKMWELQELIDICLRPEILNKDNLYECSSCGGMRQATRTHIITKAPLHLLLVLKLFRFDPVRKQRLKFHGRLKTVKSIQLPVHYTANSTPSQSPPTPVSYDLKSVVLHAGSSLDGGHYFSTAVDQQGQWYIFNDSHVSTTSSAWVVGNGTPYILLLRRSDVVEDQVFIPLPHSLQALVNRDNQKFLHEQKYKQPKVLVRRRESDEDWDEDNDSSFNGAGPSLVF